MHPRHSWQPPSRSWHSSRGVKRRYLFWRFAGLFGGMLIFFTIGMLLLLPIVDKPLSQVFPSPSILFLVMCVLPAMFFLLVGGLAFRRMGTPLVDVMSAADAVAEGDLNVRVREDYRGEFGRLARSFNRMTAELARAEQQRRNLTADVAHELRTPFAYHPGQPGRGAGRHLPAHARAHCRHPGRDPPAGAPGQRPANPFAGRSRPAAPAP